MQPRLCPYIITGLGLVLLFTAAAYFAWQGWIIPAALSIALFWQQVAFIGHDLGHSAVSHDRGVDNLLGLLVNAGVGIGMSWWKSTHNVHHLVVNTADSDPDIQVVTLCIIPGFLYSHVLKSDTKQSVFVWTVLCLNASSFYCGHSLMVCEQGTLRRLAVAQCISS